MPAQVDSAYTTNWPFLWTNVYISYLFILRSILLGERHPSRSLFNLFTLLFENKEITMKEGINLVEDKRRVLFDLCNKFFNAISFTKYINKRAILTMHWKKNIIKTSFNKNGGKKIKM